MEHSVYLMHSLLLSIQSFLWESSSVQYATLPEQFSNNTSLIQDLFSRYLWSVIYDHRCIYGIGAFGVFDAFSTFIHPKRFVWRRKRRQDNSHVLKLSLANERKVNHSLSGIYTSVGVGKNACDDISHSITLYLKAEWSYYDFTII